jgi:hypothetical protein
MQDTGPTHPPLKALPCILYPEVWEGGCILNPREWEDGFRYNAHDIHVQLRTGVLK